MRYAKIISVIPLIAVLVIGCAKQSDEDAIQALLESSWFVGDGAIQNADDSTNVLESIIHPGFLADTIGYVHWVRWIDRPVMREFDIIVNGDSADVTITAYFQGEPLGYGMFVNNDPLGPVYQRAIADSVIRRVKLFHDGNHWCITRLTVADIYTAETAHCVTITEIKARVEARNYEWICTNPETYYSKDELPIFYPSDTVEVFVICTCQDDSTWAFLHHGTGHRPGHGIHIRQPFYRDNTTTFSRTWIIADDNIIITPAVRHSAVDVLGWQTLFGDSLATYYSKAWCMPYIVMEPGQAMPEDEE